MNCCDAIYKIANAASRADDYNTARLRSGRTAALVGDRWPFPFPAREHTNKKAWRIAGRKIDCQTHRQRADDYASGDVNGIV